MNHPKFSKTYNVKANLLFALKRSAMRRIILFIIKKTTKRKQIYQDRKNKSEFTQRLTIYSETNYKSYKLQEQLKL